MFSISSVPINGAQERANKNAINADEPTKNSPLLLPDFFCPSANMALPMAAMLANRMGKQLFMKVSLKKTRVINDKE